MIQKKLIKKLLIKIYKYFIIKMMILIIKIFLVNIKTVIGNQNIFMKNNIIVGNMCLKCTIFIHNQNEYIIS